MQLQPADGAGRDEPSGLGHRGRAARRIDAHERNHDIRIGGGEGEDVVVRSGADGPVRCSSTVKTTHAILRER